jgi:hypothetical protein
MNTCATCKDDSCPEHGRDCNGCEDWTNEEPEPEPNPDQLGILDEYEARLVAVESELHALVTDWAEFRRALGLFVGRTEGADRG